MPASAPPAMSQGTRSADRAIRAGPVAVPSPRPHAEQKRASGEHAEPQEGQKLEAGEGIAANLANGRRRVSQHEDSIIL
jgi:hypothetical protein